MVMYSGWPRIRLREAADESVYAWFEPPGEHVVIPDKYVDAPELNMRGASLVRLKHGVGASYDADLFTVYSGGWKAGRRHGFGSEASFRVYVLTSTDGAKYHDIPTTRVMLLCRFLEKGFTKGTIMKENA